MTSHPPIERVAREPEPGPEPDGDNSSIVMRAGFIVAGGVVAALVASLPAALRVGHEGAASRAIEPWLTLAAALTPLTVALVAILRRARVGVRLLVGEHVTAFAAAVLWWGVIELGLLSLFGALLRKTTHHHALAGVTFSAFALVTGVLVALFTRRMTATLARGGAGVVKIGLLVAALCALAATVFVATHAARIEGLRATGMLVDGLAIVVTTVIASSRSFGCWRPMAIGGLPAAVLLVMVGLTTLRFDPKLQQSLLEGAPIHAFVMGLFGS